MFDGKAFGAEVVDIVKGFITKALHDIKIDIAGLIQRVDDLELREPVDGTNGKDADPAFVVQTVHEAVAKLPKPRDGNDGKDADPKIIMKMVADAVAALPKPKDGMNGNDGASITIDDVAPIIAREVTIAVSKITVPKDGVGLSGAFIDRTNALVLTLSDGSTRELGIVVGKDGHSVTKEEIAVAVASYLQTNPPAKGEAGKNADPDEIEKALAERLVSQQTMTDNEFSARVTLCLGRSVEIRSCLS